MSNAGKSTLFGKLKRLRALAMLRLKISHAMSNKALAVHFNVSRDTVDRALELALKEGLVEDYEMELLKDLVPEAMAAVKKAMREGDAQVGLEILKGTGLLKKQIDKSKIAISSGEEPDLDVYIRSRRSSGTLSQHASSPAGALPPEHLQLPDPHLSLHSAETAPEILARPHDGGLPTSEPPPHHEWVAIEAELLGPDESEGGAVDGE